VITLGLDASTTTCGYCIVDGDTILDNGWIDLTEKETVKEKVWLIIEFIKNHNRVSEISNINLESALCGFAGGFTSQQTLIKLIRMSSVLEYVLTEQFQSKKINLIGAMTARKKAFGKARIKGVKSKIFVRSQLELKYDLTKYIKLTSRGNEDKRNEDWLDALVLALNH
jgi:Holliday junction resolvasome RuvABC endonuclease subunit